MILEKLREGLQPVYKEFIQTYAPKDTKDDIRILEYEKLKYVYKSILYIFIFAHDFTSFSTIKFFRETLRLYMKDKITEHEIITIARFYSPHKKIEHKSREYVRYV